MCPPKCRPSVPGFTFTFSVFTFIGEALLIPWLLWRALKGFPASGTAVEGPALKPVPA